MGLLARIGDRRRNELERNSIDWYIQNMLIPAATQFGFNNHTYQVGGAQMTGLGMAAREVANNLPAYMAAFRACPPAFAAQMVRAMVLAQVRFCFRNRPYAPLAPRKLFGNSSLSLLEQPWPNGTTGQLVSIMEWHEGLTGNAYVYRRRSNLLKMLRPDWVGVLYGSDLDPDDPMVAVDAELLGYVYQPGGFLSPRGTLSTLLPNEVAHWAPNPDPENPGIGMSWATPGLRDMQGDRAMTEHKLMYLSNGATPNLVIKGLPSSDKAKFDAAVAMLEEKHTGLANAYRTLYLTAGADATVVGSNLQQLDFINVQGRGETRIAMLSRVPAAILQISEALQGSSLNAGAWPAARRNFADTFVYGYLQNLAACLGTIMTDVPPLAELWFDTTDMPILREDAKDLADIASTDATTIGGLVKDGFKPQSAIDAVVGRDMTLLKYDDRFISVQLQALAAAKAGPGGTPPNGTPNGGPPAPPGQQPAPAPAKAPAPPAPPAKAEKSEPQLVVLEPHVNVDVHLAPQDVRVEAPAPQQLPAPAVNVEVKVPQASKVRRSKQVERDDAGNVTRIVETEEDA